MKYLVALAAVVCVPLAPTSALAAAPECFGPDETLDYELTEPAVVGVCFDDGTNLTIQVTQEPSKGDVETTPASGDEPAQIQYTANALGSDTLRFQATDGAETSNEVTVTTNNIPFVDDPPACFGSELPEPGDFEVGESALLGDCFDPEGGDVHVTITQQGTHGTAIVQDQDTPAAYLSYTAADAGGNDTVKFKASDGTQESGVFTATTHNVPFVNDTPICFPTGDTFDLFVPTIAGACEDEEDDPLTIAILQQPARGTVETIEQGSRLAAPLYTARVPGADVFRFQASDGNTTSDPVTVTTDNVGVLPNLAPRCPRTIGRLAAVGERRAFGCEDLENDPVTYSILQAPAKGSVDRVDAPSGRHLLRYTAERVGLDFLTFRASDGKGGQSPVVPVTFTNRPLLSGSTSGGSATPDRRGNITLRARVDCAGVGEGPDCRVSAAASAKLAPRAAAATKRKKARTVKIGKSHFVVKAGSTGKVRVKLSKKGLKLLRRLRKIKATVTVDVTRGAIGAHKKIKVTLKAPKRKRTK
jgi:hypothetical protein